MALAGTARAQTTLRADSVLDRTVTLELRNASLSDALARLRHEHALPLAWSGDVLPPDHRVTLALRQETLRNTLLALLADTGLDFALTRQGTVVIVPCVPNGGMASSGDSAGSERSVERLRLATGVRQLDQIVVMGTAVAGAPQREQPNAMTVVGSATLEDAPHSRLADLIRALLPGVVLWERGPAGPPPQFASVRGVSSFTTRGLKTYVDDIELASPELFTLVNGRGIERIEVMRGPQGAALYGPDALNGVMQIITRKGQVGAPLHPRGSASLGSFDRPDLSDMSLWQDHALGLSGGGSSSSFDAVGTFARTGSSGEVPWLSSWTAQAGGRAVLGTVVVSGSARAGRHEYGAERLNTGATTAPVSAPQELSERGAGITLTHAPTSHWRQTLIAGHHWISGEREPGSSLLLTPRLPLGATHETAWRSSVRYGSTFEAPIGGHEGSLAAGIEYSRRHVERAERRLAASRDLRPLYDDDLKSTGGFGQARLRLGTGLVLSAGTRAEWPSSVGENSGPSWASTAGATWSHPVGRSLLRLRAAWGRGIRPPEPGMSRAMAASGIRQDANPELAPETQTGVEAGAEVHLNETFIARVTWYDQRAEDLIQQVPLRTDGTERVYQFQNLGAIRNRGVELEAGLHRGRFTATGALYLNQSNVTRLAPSYTGFLRPGDELPEIPTGVGAVRLLYRTARAGAEVGSSWLGSWIGYDWAAALGAEPARSSDRDYWIEYPGAFRPWISAWLALGSDWRAFARIDNPGNSFEGVRTNVSPPIGRSAVVGVQLKP